MKIRAIVLAFMAMIMYSSAGLDEALKAMDASDYKTAIKEFTALADQGDDKAMVQLGLFYYKGEGVQTNYSKAMDWFLMAFTNENADAFVNLGVMHRDGYGVPVNKKIAYCVFLTTHMCGLGSQDTQLRSNSCLRRSLDELSKEELKDCLSNYTLKYMTSYLKARGALKGIPDEDKPSDSNPALKDLGWWMDGELDGIFGAPSEEEKKARKRKS